MLKDNSRETEVFCLSPAPARFRSQTESVESASKEDWQQLRMNQTGCHFTEKRLYLLYSIIAQKIKWEQEKGGLWAGVGLVSGGVSIDKLIGITVIC